MATLVLSTAGTVLGGPVGGAIGALIGQSLDRQLLGPATRGPRVGDLSVQSSSYGTQIPRVYGSMRVAGTVVWSTDLVESKDMSGVKGQPDLTYSYSVSLAVALSSRPAGAIGRIWADGKLLRGAEGDFKLPVTFRLHDGSENQQIDPLIASIEGIENTPAYRGLALAVFENLELAAFGNRIPFMTFEVIADAESPTISTVLGDASAGAIASDAPQSIVGYAAYGSSIGAAVQPLIDSFDVRLFDDGSSLRTPADESVVAIGADELGNSSDGHSASKIQREQQPVTSVPSSLRLSYYDPDRDYQAGESRAVAIEATSNETKLDLPAVLSAGDGKTLAQQILARRWSARDKLTLRLPPSRIALEPGSIVDPGLAPASWLVDKCTIDGFVTIVELLPSWKPRTVLVGDSGRIVPNSDIVAAPPTYALIEAPSVAREGPVILIAASSPTGGLGARAITLTGSGQSFATETAARQSILGHCVTELGSADPYLIDRVNSVDVELVDPEQWLLSCDDDALANGANLAMVGEEMIQFGEATSLGQGRFRLSRLLRGRGGTEWAGALHAEGEIFCLLDPATLRSLAIPVWMRGSMLMATDRDGTTVSTVFKGGSALPLSPVDLSAIINGTGDMVVSWIRRSRAGFAWIDEIDAPIGESAEQYRVTVTTGAGSLDVATGQPSITIAAPEVASLGSGQATVEVRQIGDWGASPPSQIIIDLP